VGQLTLFSIDGKGFDSKRFRQGEIPQEVETFHDWPVLGKTEIVDGQQRLEVLAALRSAINQGKHTAKCFWPRHAIRIVSKGKMTEYLICFECAQVHIYRDGGVTVQAINGVQQDVLDQYLKDAGVPLAP
jgi:hypothetical protein